MRVALVRLREAGQIVTYKINDDIAVHDWVIVDADSGIDCWEIIDGLQRFTAIKRFIIDKDLMLSGLEFLTDEQLKLLCNDDDTSLVVGLVKIIAKRGLE